MILLLAMTAWADCPELDLFPPPGAEGVPSDIPHVMVRQATRIGPQDFCNVDSVVVSTGGVEVDLLFHRFRSSARFDQNLADDTRYEVVVTRREGTASTYEFTTGGPANSATPEDPEVLWVDFLGRRDGRAVLDVGVHWEPETPFHTLKVNMGSPQPWRSGFDEAPDELVLNVDDEGVQSPPSVSGSRVCVWAVVEAPGPVSRGADLLGADRSCVSTCSTGTAVSSVPAFTAALLLVLAGRRRRGDP